MLVEACHCNFNYIVLFVTVFLINVNNDMTTVLEDSVNYQTLGLL